jgi:hypothetical protein
MARRDEGAYSREICTEQQSYPAASKMARKAFNRTFQAPAFMHEAWLRLIGKTIPRSRVTPFLRRRWRSQASHPLDKSQHKCALRHGGNQRRPDLESVAVAALFQDAQPLAVNDTLDKLLLRTRSKSN